MEIVRFSLAPQPMQELIFTGRNYDSQTALNKGVVDELSTADQLLTRAVAMAEQMGRIPSESYRIVKQRLRSGVLEKAKQTSTEEIHRLWDSPQIHATIRAYLNRTIKKK
jgi:enoyl-CoA hydratase/carnithine racemase